MKIKLLLIFFLLCCSFKNSFSQITIKGAILSAKNNKPISFATIQLVDKSTKNTLNYTTTDLKGIYSLEIKSKGNYAVKISHISYLTLTQDLLLKENINEKIFYLKPNINSLKEVVLDFEPKAMKIFGDTITYNLKQLTNGREKTLSDIIQKLPGVKINSSGRIIVNGKIVKKLLIDGEELFRNQHQTTTESIDAKMIQGIRYLDKYNDFGNITGFDNKQTNALDVSIKDEYKNRITGNIKAQGGHKSKYLANTNLFKFGGNLKLGFIGDWNTLGKQSITTLEYNELKGISYEEVDQNGFTVNNIVDDSPKFLDPTIDIAQRENLFTALSLIYKPSHLTKLSFLHIFSKTNQRQFFENTRQFFESSQLNFFENKNVNSSFLLNSTLFNFGYQPNEKSFIEYAFNFNPQLSKEKFQINLTNSFRVLNVSQQLQNMQFTLDQKASYLNRITNKTLLKFTGLFMSENKNSDLTILSNNTILPPLNSNIIFQKNMIINNSFGYKLQSVTNIKKNRLRFSQGIIFSKNSFNNTANDNSFFNNNFQSERVDNYFNTSFDGKINKKLKITGSLAYKLISLNRFEDSFSNIFIQPSFSLLYKPKSSQTLNFEYNYAVDLPNDSSVISNPSIENYYTIINKSKIQNDQILPDHKFNSYYSYYNSSSGSSFSTFINYSFAPKFISTNNTVDENGNITFNNFTGRNRYTLNFNLKFDKRLKSKLGIYSNFNFFNSEAENSINNELNLTKTTILKNKSGIYSRFKKGINFNIGLDIEFTNYRITQQNIETLASIKKPFIDLNGSIKKDIITWNLGSFYALYETDLNKEHLLNIYPSLTYKITDKLELSLIGNNVLNIKNANISQNINADNYFESSIVSTLEGYIIIGLSYNL